MFKHKKKPISTDKELVQQGFARRLLQKPLTIEDMELLVLLADLLGRRNEGSE